MRCPNGAARDLTVWRGSAQGAQWLLRHRVTINRGDSSEQIKAWFGSNAGRAQLAFIDGDHTFEGTMRDWTAIEPFLDKKAVVVLHDTNPESCNWRGPRFLLEKLNAHGGRYGVVNLPTADGFGLALVQKLSDDLLTYCTAPLAEFLKEHYLVDRHFSFLRMGTLRQKLWRRYIKK